MKVSEPFLKLKREREREYRRARRHGGDGGEELEGRRRSVSHFDGRKVTVFRMAVTGSLVTNIGGTHTWLGKNLDYKFQFESKIFSRVNNFEGFWMYPSDWNFIKLVFIIFFSYLDLIFSYFVYIILFIFKMLSNIILE